MMTKLRSLRRLSTLLFALAGSAFASTGAAFAVASNDNFDNAATISGANATATASNAGATSESGEPNTYSAESSLWWTWTAPSDGYVTMNTFGTNFDNSLFVYQGGSFSTLDEVVGNHNGLGTKNGLDQSQVQFPVKAGQVFKIQVGAYGGTRNTGTIILNVSLGTLASGGIRFSGAGFFGAPVPFNDLFANSKVISGSAITAVGFNSSARNETGEPNPNTLEGSLWWTWTAPSDGYVTIDTTGTTFDNSINVYQGSTFATMDLVDTDHGGLGQNQSEVQFPAKAGQVFKIQVGGYDSTSNAGTVMMNLQLGTLASDGIANSGTAFYGAPSPYNDDLANAPLLTGSAFTAVGFSDWAGNEPGEPNPNTAEGTLWWAWTAPSSGFVTLNTSGTNFDNVLNVYQGSAFGTFVLVASNHNGLGSKNGFGQSQVVFPVQAGQVFRFQVGGFDSSSNAGVVLLNLKEGTLASGGVTTPSTDFWGAPSAGNDNFNNAQVVSGNEVTAAGFNAWATTETGEPLLHNGNQAQTLWWSWTAPSTETVTVNTFGTTFDNVVAVYQGTVVSKLTLVAQDHNSLGIKNGLDQSQVQFAATAGQTYKIQVGAYNYGNTGTVLMNINPPAATGTKTQAITFPAIAAKTLGTSPLTFSPGATASSGLPVTYVIINNPVSVSGSTVTLGNTVTIQATQTGNATYAPATPVSQTVTFK